MLSCCYQHSAAASLKPVLARSFLRMKSEEDTLNNKAQKKRGGDGTQAHHKCLVLTRIAFPTSFPPESTLLQQERRDLFGFAEC